MQGETSYTNSFDIAIKNDGFIFIPRLPCSYILDDELYNKIFLIANASLYPRFTLLKQNTTYFVAMTKQMIFTHKEAYSSLWKSGTSERLVISDLTQFAETIKEKTIPIMRGFSINLDKVNSICISGSSGGGKSYLTTYLLEFLKSKNNSDIIIVDPKFDTPSRWARANNIPRYSSERKPLQIRLCF